MREKTRGYGTLDELFETLTLVQTRKITPLALILVGEEYWRQAGNMDFLFDEGMIDSRDHNTPGASLIRPLRTAAPDPTVFPPPTR